MHICSFCGKIPFSKLSMEIEHIWTHTDTCTAWKLEWRPLHSVAGGHDENRDFGPARVSRASISIGGSRHIRNDSTCWRFLAAIRDCDTRLHRDFHENRAKTRGKQQMCFGNTAKLNSNNTTQHVLVYMYAPRGAFKCFGACTLSCSSHAGLSARSPSVAWAVPTPSTASVSRVLPTHSNRRSSQAAFASHAHNTQTAQPGRRSAYASRVTAIRSRDVNRVRRGLSATVYRTTSACVQRAAPTPFPQK